MWIQWLFFFKILNQRLLTPRWPFDPKSVEVMCDSTQGSLCPSLMKIHQCVDTVTLFFKNLNQRSLTPRWPLTSCLLRSHVWLYPMIIVSKSHENTSMSVDTVNNFAKYHIRTYYRYYIHRDVHTMYYIQNEWSHSLFLNMFRWDKNEFYPSLSVCVFCLFVCLFLVLISISLYWWFCLIDLIKTKLQLNFHNISNITFVNFQPFCAFLNEFGSSFHIFDRNSSISLTFLQCLIYLKKLLA